MKELLFSINRNDLCIDFFSGTGKGGQYRNKHQNCVRIRHKESGAIATGQSHRERLSNIKEALNNLVKSGKFKIWLNGKVFEIKAGKTIEQIVEELCSDDNLKIEAVEEGRWVEWHI